MGRTEAPNFSSDVILSEAKYPHLAASLRTLDSGQDDICYLAFGLRRRFLAHALADLENHLPRLLVLVSIDYDVIPM